MKKIFVDLEMTPSRMLPLPSGGQLSVEIIEIGAVALDEQGKRTALTPTSAPPV